MNSPLRPLVAVAAVVFASVSAGVFANPIVEAPAYTPNHGPAGGPTVFHPTLKITNGGSVDFHNVWIWEFLLDWDPSVLAFDPTNLGTTISFGAYNGLLSGAKTYLAGLGSPVTATDNLATATADGYYALRWESDGTTYLDLGAEIDFQGSYTILVGAAPADYLFDFEVNSVSSSIVDKDLNSFSYLDVTQGSRMMIRVDATPTPEPGMVGLLLGGLGAYLGAMRLRRRAGK